MKKMVTLVFALILSIGTLHAQDFKGLDKSPLDLIEYPSSNKETSKLVRVLYSRPQLKGREFSSLVPDGKVWRLGANEATEVTFYVPMKMNGTQIAAGSYTLYALPQDGKMTFILNKATHVWGAYGYNQDMDVARMTVPITEAGQSVEAFSMAFETSSDGVHLQMGWGKHRMNLPFTK
jgi:hypothetical protein